MNSRYRPTTILGPVTALAAATLAPLEAAGQADFPLEDGELVTTTFPLGSCGDWGGWGFDPDDPAVWVYDSRLPPPIGPVPAPGSNWIAPKYADPTWTPRHLGLVFGLSLDTALPPNIYVAATTVYGNFQEVFSECPDVPGGFGPDGPGAVYRLDGVTGAIGQWVITGAGGVGTNEIPNTGPGLGNVCHDPTHDQFFATNHEDGRIYRIDAGGVIQSVFDPFDPDDASPGFAPRGERLWGLQVYEDRLYFAVWLRDVGNQATPWPPAAGPAPPSPNNSIWSVEINPAGGDFSGAEQLEIVMPYLDPGNQNFWYSNPVSDISFTPDGVMLLAEHTMASDFGQIDMGHFARVLEYEFTSSWTPSPREYWIGSLLGPLNVPHNTAGGIDYDCDLNVWSSGDTLLFGPTIYGLQRVPAIGNSSTNPVNTSYEIGVDNAAKGGVGDVEVYVLEPCETWSGCGDPNSGDCFVPHPLPGCSDLECCELACAVNAYCCTVTWDAGCVGLAQEVCDSGCEILCPAGALAEGEACGGDSNHGCDLAPAMFTQAQCGDVFCGTAWADNGARDTDWYEFFVPDNDGDGQARVEVIFTSEFPGVVRLHDDQCGNLITYATGESIDCQTVTISACVPAPAAYFVSVKPETLGGGPVLNGYPCGTPFNDYVLDLRCYEPCDPDPSLDDCHVGWDHPFCLNVQTITINVLVCNWDVVAHNYQLGFDGLSDDSACMGTDCTIPGPTVGDFTILGPNPVSVPPGTCVPVAVQINRPAGMTFLGAIACFRMTMLNLETGLETTCCGTLVDRRDLCVVIDFEPVVVDVPIGTDVGVPIVVGNTGFPGDVVDIWIVATGADGGPSLISLDGLPPGEPVVRTVKIPPGVDGSFELILRAVAADEQAIEDVVLSTDNDGDGAPDLALISFPARAVEAARNPADVNGDGVVGVDDLVAVILAWGPCSGACPEDVTGDGVVSVDDLVAVILSWT